MFAAGVNRLFHSLKCFRIRIRYIFKLRLLFCCMNFREEIVKILTEATTLSASEIEPLLTIPPGQNLGDFAFPCFKLGKNPVQAAKDLQSKLKLPPSIQKAVATGPYLNFYLAPEVVAEYTLSTIHKQKEK